jgi:hypothetical protein
VWLAPRLIWLSAPKASSRADREMKNGNRKDPGLFDPPPFFFFFRFFVKGVLWVGDWLVGEIGGSGISGVKGGGGKVMEISPFLKRKSVHRHCEEREREVEKYFRI